MKLIVDKNPHKYFMWSKVYKHLVKHENKNLIGFINEITIYKR